MKKQVIRRMSILLLFGLVMLSITVSAITISPVYVGPGTQRTPAVSGDIIVWGNYSGSGNEAIYMYDLANPSAGAQRVYNDPGWQTDPAISGNIIVWDSEWDIYLYDLATPGAGAQLVNTGPGDQFVPAISGNIIVWSDTRNGDYDIYRYDLANPGEGARPVYVGPGMQINPAISGNIIVWDSEGDISMYDLANPAAGTQSVYVGQFIQHNPAISGNIIVWAGDQIDGVLPNDIYMYDISHPEDGAQSIYRGRANMKSVEISGNIIVWADWADIYMYDLDNPTAGAQHVTTDSFLQLNPDISGNIIVWQDGRNKYYDIYMADLGTMTITTAGSGFIGDPIVISGTNTISAKTYLYATGPNLNPNGILLGVVDVAHDGTWTFTWLTDSNPGGTLDPGTYTIYASGTPIDLPKPDSYAKASIVLKKPLDTDAEGIPDREEQGPSGTDPAYDGNNDGIPDSSQNNVASFHGSTGVYITIAATVPLHDVKPVTNPSPDNAPKGVLWPAGLFTFSLDVKPPGGSAVAKIYLPKGTNPTTYYKYGPEPFSKPPHWYEFLFIGNEGANYNRNTGAKIYGSEVTLHLVDGKRGDDDITANGVITDPSGPGIETAIPVKVRIVPNTLNTASKGKFVAFITLPSNYKAADVDAKSVKCEGAPAIRLIRIKAFPNTFAALFNREKLVNVKPEDKVKVTVTGIINKNGQKVGFSGGDIIKVISKKGTTKEIIDDVEKMTDEKVFSQFNPQ